jgi:nucleotide-binding universal stress UspA family protein
MTYRVVLVPVLGDPADAAALAVTGTIMGQMRSHIVGLHVRSPISMAVTGSMFEGAYLSPDIITALEDSRQASAATARDGFRQWQEASGIEMAAAPGGPATLTAEWSEVEAAVSTEIGSRGRTADLIVLARSSREYSATTDDALHGALFYTGRPILLVSGPPPADLFGTAVIAWNDSREAAHATAAAWSLLGRARRIVIFIGGEDEALRRSADRLVTHLAWRGYAAATVVPDASGDAGAALLAVANRERAGLIVMGAYSHSRLRHFAFGGVTSHIFKNTTIPVLMAH